MILPVSIIYLIIKELKTYLVFEKIIYILGYPIINHYFISDIIKATIDIIEAKTEIDG